MRQSESLLDHVARDFEELALRVARIIASFRSQKTTVQLEHYWELERVRIQFAEFKRRLIDLEDSDGLESTAVEASWKELVLALDDLQNALAAANGSLSDSHQIREFHNNNLPWKGIRLREVPD